MPDIQIPQPSPEMQAHLKQKQLFVLAILQAVANGLKIIDGFSESQFQVLLAEFSNNAPIASGMPTIDFLIKNAGYKTIIFSQEFLKAFFGEYWWEHGCQMLKAEKPLFYLEQYIQPVKPKEEWR